jgi:LysR family transcriptional regulator, transcription activator of glutamate synthase operon
MELRQIEYVEAVARHASFTRAAAELHVAQPALSAAVRRLETELGVRLFERTSRRVVVTPAGEAFLGRARRLINEVDQLASEMRDFAGGARGLLRISAWYHVEPEISLFLQEFVAANPLVEVSILEVPTPEGLDLLRAGDLDMAMIVINEGLDLTGVVHRVMKTEPYVLVTAPGHPFASRQSIDVAEVLHKPFIVTREGTALRRCFDRAFAGFAEPPRVVIETNELAATVAFVSIGLGNAILTRSIAERVGVPVGIVPVAGPIPFALAAAWADRPQNSVTERAIEMVAAHIPVAEESLAAPAIPA